MQDAPAAMTPAAPPGPVGLGNESDGPGPFFSRTDWTSFFLATTAVLSLYLLTLAPDVTLGFSGIFSVGAMYGGVPHPPGYPLATLWSRLFIHLLPFTSIAWRVAVSSAVAGALACGVIALLVSRAGAELVGEPTDRRWQRMRRAACGLAAGAIFGANGAFWGNAVIANLWALSILVLCLVLCLLMRWIHQPGRKRFLFGAAVLYGLALTNSQIQLALLPAIPFLVWAGSRALARDMFMAGTILSVAYLLGVLVRLFASSGVADKLDHPLHPLLLIITGVTASFGIRLVVVTRQIFTEWKCVLGCAASFFLGLSLYLYVPIASMTNPPMNWGYPRTAEGFLHTITRGQYEIVRPTASFSGFARQCGAYAVVTGKELAWPYVPLILAPWLYWRRMTARARGWMGGWLAAYVCLAFLMLAVLNPAADRQSLELNKVFFSASYVVLALWLGCGLALVRNPLVKPPRPPVA